jgi:hypothetical protein
LSLGPPHMTERPGPGDHDVLASDDIVIVVVSAPTYEITVWRPPTSLEGVVSKNAVERWLRRVLEERVGLRVIEPSTGDEVYLIVEAIAGVRVAEARHLPVAVRQLESYTRGRGAQSEEASFAGLVDR